MHTRIPAYLTLITCALLATNSYAGKDGDVCEHKERLHHVKHSRPTHKMVKHLDLSEEQQKQFKAVQQKNKASYEVQNQALRDNHKQLHELVAAGGYTEEKAAQLAKRHGEIAAELVRLRTAEMAQLYTLLTPEQQKKFSSPESKGPREKGESEG
jgi:Spy/CpxP family protein refolding chaperone